MIHSISPFARSYLRARSDLMMQSTCTIVRPGSLTKVGYDKVTRQATTNDGTQVYEGLCRLWQVAAGGKSWEQDREVAIATTYLSLPHGHVAEPNDLVFITADDDAELVGRSLTVEAVTRGGGLRGSRVMKVQFNDYEEVGAS